MKNYKEKILELKEKGYTFTQIQKELGCSKSTISYHLNPVQKDKASKRSKAYREATGSIHRRINGFCSFSRSQKRNINKRIDRFHIEQGTEQYKTGDPTGLYKTRSFSGQDLLEKFTGKCYLTGRDLDIEDPNSYQLDHIQPRSKGGPNTLDNCEFACKSANIAKGNLSLDEFKQLCLDVVNHFNLK